jgi:hypothetical protein
LECGVQPARRARHRFALAPSAVGGTLLSPVSTLHPRRQECRRSMEAGYVVAPKEGQPARRRRDTPVARVGAIVFRSACGATKRQCRFALLAHSKTNPPPYGVRCQARRGRDTALLSRPAAAQSAGVASLCRRTPRRTRRTMECVGEPARRARHRFHGLFTRLP